jgi:hypothetical protein
MIDYQDYELRGDLGMRKAKSMTNQLNIVHIITSDYCYIVMCQYIAN